MKSVEANEKRKTKLKTENVITLRGKKYIDETQKSSSFSFKENQTKKVVKGVTRVIYKPPFNIYPSI